MKALEGTGFSVTQSKKIIQKNKLTPIVLSWISAGAFLWCLQILFLPGESYIPMICSVFAMGLFMYVLSKFKWGNLIGVSAYVILMLSVIVLFFDKWSSGALNFFNQILLRINYVTGMSLDYFEINNTDGISGSTLLFFVTVSLLVTCYFELVIARKHTIILLILWLPAISASVLLGVTIGTLVVVFSVLSIVGTFAYSQAENDSIIYTLTILGLGVVMVVAGFIYFWMIDYSPSQTMEKWRTTIRKEVESQYYGKYDYAEGNSTFVETGETDTSLEVRMSKPARLYLRGYIGSKWENNKFLELDGKDYTGKYEGMINKYYEKEFHPLSQLSAFINAREKEGIKTNVNKINVTVENINASKKYTYIPYGIEFNDLKKLGASRQDLYEPGNPEEEKSVYTAEVFETNWEGFLANGVDKWLTVDTDKSELSAAYKDGEADYRNFVYKVYLGSKEEGAKVTNSWDESAKSSLENMTKKIRSVFEEENADEENNSAYYSAKAVLYYRSLGVPARYAEGYIVDGTKEEGEGEKTVSVLSSDAHAWVEIYKEGMGWLPIEVAPGFVTELGAMQQPQESTSTYENQSTSESKEDEEKEDKTKEETESNGLVIVFIIVGSILALILLFVITLVIRRAILLSKRKDMSMDELMKLTGKIYLVNKWEESKLPSDIYKLLNKVRFSNDYLVLDNDILALKEYNDGVLLQMNEKDGVRDKMVNRFWHALY